MVGTFISFSEGAWKIGDTGGWCFLLYVLTLEEFDCSSRYTYIIFVSADLIEGNIWNQTKDAHTHMFWWYYNIMLNLNPTTCPLILGPHEKRRESDIWPLRKSTDPCYQHAEVHLGGLKGGVFGVLNGGEHASWLGCFKRGASFNWFFCWICDPCWAHFKA